MKNGAIFILGVFFSPLCYSQAKLPVKEILAAGLTYKKHIRETGEKVDKVTPLIFVKKTSSAYAVENGTVGSVRVPSDSESYTELEKIEKGLSAKLKEEFDTFPKMLDYEGELGIYFLKDLSLSELEDPKTLELQNSIGFFAANDLSLRSFQVLADKDPKKYTYWSAAKSFDRFLPMSEIRRVRSFSLEQWAPHTIETWVDSETEPRQSANLTQSIYSPRQYLVAAAKRKGGTILKGTVLLTGSPSGTAFNTPKLKKCLAEFIGLDRFQKLAIASNDPDTLANYLKPGSKVTVKVQGVGSVSVVLSK